MASAAPPPPPDLLAAWAEFEGAAVVPLPGGLINHTYIVTRGDRRWILQRLHTIYRAELHDDIEAVTRHLAARGLVTPLLVRTRAGALSQTDADGRLWRALDYIDGRTFHRLERPAQAAAAGALVARFHRALADLDHRFAFVRPEFHDTPGYLARLEQSLAGAAPALRALGEQVLALGRALPLPGGLPPRLIHGDLKISNVIFAPDADRALALCDLDSLARMSIPIEMGDALRSWSNPLGEDVEATRLDGAVFEAALAGYREAAGDLLTREEIDALVPGFLTITLELAARFACDAIEDRYFGWDPARFPSRREHNRVRAVGQLTLTRAGIAARADLEAVVRRLWLAT